jgi:hypothetical protein
MGGAPLTDHSARPLTIGLEYPLYVHVRFDSPSATRKLVLLPENYMAPVPTVQPGGRASRTYYLNRYLTFDVPGTARVTWRFSVSVSAEDEPLGYLVGRGELTYALVETGDEALEEELSKYAVGLKSHDEKVAAEAAEALGFLDTPLALEALPR